MSDREKNVLLILSAGRQSPEAERRAMESAAKEGARLVILFVLEADASSAVVDRLSNADFIGDRQTRELSEALSREYRQRAYEVLGGVETRAKGQGIPLKLLLEKGRFLDESLKAIERYTPLLTVVTREPRSMLSRLIRGSETEKLKAQSQGPVIVINN